MAKAPRPNSMNTGAPPPKPKPGDFVLIDGKPVNIVHAVFPSAGARITQVQCWDGTINHDTGRPIMSTYHPDDVVVAPPFFTK